MEDQILASLLGGSPWGAVAAMLWWHLREERKARREDVADRARRDDEQSKVFRGLARDVSRLLEHARVEDDAGDTIPPPVGRRRARTPIPGADQ